MSLSSLPSEILLNIFSGLSDGSLASVSLTCRVLREHANSVLWSSLDLENRICPRFFDEVLAIDPPSSRASSMFSRGRRCGEVGYSKFLHILSSGYVLDETWAKVRTLVLGPSVLWSGESIDVGTESYARGIEVQQISALNLEYRCTNGEFPTALTGLFEQGKLSGLREVRIRYGGGSVEAILPAFSRHFGQRSGPRDVQRLTQVVSAVTSLTRAIGSFASVNPNPVCLKVETSDISNIVDLISASPAAILSLRSLKLVGTLSTHDRDTVNDLLARAVGLESLWYEPGRTLQDGSFWDPVGGPLNKMIKLETLWWTGQLPSEVTRWAAPLRLKRFLVRCYFEKDWEHLAVQPLSGVESLRLFLPQLFPPVPVAFHDLRSLCVEVRGSVDGYCTVSPIITANPNLECVHVTVPTLEASQVVRALAALENSKLKSLSIDRPRDSTYNDYNRDEDLTSDLVVLAPASPHLNLLRLPLGGKSKFTTTIAETLLTCCRELDAMIVDTWVEQSQELLFPNIRARPPAECPVCSDVRVWFHNLKPKHMLQTSRGPVEGYDFNYRRMNSFFMNIEGSRQSLRSE